MCTQELIWCSCGHGEFLPIKLCSTGQQIGTCWTIVHGDHNIVLQSRCSYCQAGLNRRRPLRSPRPRGEVAERTEGNGRMGDVLEGGKDGDGHGEDVVRRSNTVIGVDDWDKMLEGTDAATTVGIETATEKSSAVEESTGDFSFDDVMSTEFEKGFDLSDELWTYDDFALGSFGEKGEVKE